MFLTFDLPPLYHAWFLRHSVVCWVICISVEIRTLTFHFLLLGSNKMSNIILYNKSSTPQQAPAVSLMLKGTREYYNYTHRRESYEKLSGPRESCEDITCMDCGVHIRNKNYDAYKTCKKQCFQDKKSDIIACCYRSCDGLGQGVQSCMKACDNELVFNS